MSNWPKGYNREHFLADMVNKRGFTTMAELGVWKGRTFLHVLLHCKKCKVYGVDAWKYRPENESVPGGETYSNWDMKSLEGHVRECAEVFGDRAKIMKMETSEAADQMPDGSLDIVFIDADHSEHGVKTDIDNWSKKVRTGGVISGHDIDWPTVQSIVKAKFGTWNEGPDNVWWVDKC